jgi:hypothetical protein
MYAGKTGEENYLFKELVKGRTIHPDMLIPKLRLTLRLISDITQNWSNLKQFEPGPLNMTPLSFFDNKQ